MTDDGPEPSGLSGPAAQAFAAAAALRAESPLPRPFELLVGATNSPAQQRLRRLDDLAQARRLGCRTIVYLGRSGGRDEVVDVELGWFATALDVADDLNPLLPAELGAQTRAALRAAALQAMAARETR